MVRMGMLICFPGLCFHAHYPSDNEEPRWIDD